MEPRATFGQAESSNTQSPLSPALKKKVNRTPQLHMLSQEEMETQKLTYQSLKKNPYQTAIEAEVQAPFIDPNAEVSTKHVFELYAILKDFINEFYKNKAQTRQNIDDISMHTQSVSDTLLNTVNEHTEHIGSLLEKQSQQDGINDDLYQTLDKISKISAIDSSKDIREIKQQLTKTQNDLNSFITGQKKQLQKMEKDNQDNSSRITEINYNLNKIQANVKEITHKVTSAETEYASNQSIEELQEQVKKINQEYIDMQAHVDTIEQEVKDQMSELNINQDKLAKEIKSKKTTTSESNETSLKSMNCRILTLQKEINKLKDNQNTVEQKALPLKVLQNSIEEIESKLQKITKVNTDITENILKNTDEIDQIREQEVKILQEQITMIQSDCQNFEKRMQDCYNFIGEVAAEQNQYKKVSQDYKEIINKMEEIQIEEKKEIAEARRNLTKNDALMKQYKKRQDDEHKKLEDLMNQINSTHKVTKELDVVKEKQINLEKTINLIEKSLENSPKDERILKKTQRNASNTHEEDKDLSNEEEEEILIKKKKVAKAKTNTIKDQNNRDLTPNKTNILPFRIPYEGKILELFPQQLLEFDGDLKEASKTINLRDPRPEEKHFKRIQFKWRGCLLITDEKELKEAKGNLTLLQDLIEKKKDSFKRIIKFNSAQKRTHDKISQGGELIRKNQNVKVQYTKEYVEKPKLKQIKKNKDDISEASSTIENNQEDNGSFRKEKGSNKH